MYSFEYYVDRKSYFYIQASVHTIKVFPTRQDCIYIVILYIFC